MLSCIVQVDLDDPAQVEEFNSLEHTIREIQVVLDGQMDKLTDQMVSMGIMEPGMQAEDEDINCEMPGRLINACAVSEDGMKFYWYNPADDIWERMSPGVG